MFNVKHSFWNPSAISIGHLAPHPCLYCPSHASPLPAVVPRQHLRLFHVKQSLWMDSDLEPERLAVSLQKDEEECTRLRRMDLIDVESTIAKASLSSPPLLKKMDSCRFSRAYSANCFT